MNLNSAFSKLKPYEFVKSAKYLGVTIDNKLNFNEHINNAVNKCKLSIFAIKRAVGKKWGLQPKILLWLYKAIIIPKMTYGSLAWVIKLTKTQENKINAVQRLMLTLITRCRENTPHAFLNLICHTIPLSEKVQETMIINAINLKIKQQWHTDTDKVGTYRTTIQKIDEMLEKEIKTPNGRI